VFNRPFDDQSSIRIKLETEAKLYIQEKIAQGELELIWSYILDYENEQNPFRERKSVIRYWRQLAAIDVEENDRILEKAGKLVTKGLKSKDALHIACAIEAGAEYFVTTDDDIIKKAIEIEDIKVMDVIQFAKVVEGK